MDIVNHANVIKEISMAMIGGRRAIYAPQLSLGFHFMLWECLFGPDPDPNCTSESVLSIKFPWIITTRETGVAVTLTIRWLLLLICLIPWLIYSKRGRTYLQNLRKWIAPLLLQTRKKLEVPLTSRQYAEARLSNRGLKYTYRSLNSRKAEIRLLYILPGSGDDEIFLSLVHANLGDCPKYTALSYTWGDAHPSRAVIINGYEFKVGPNLADALGRLRRDRSQYRGTPYWIDAICINQSDSLETSEQVELMTQIYGKAATVTVWLGMPSTEIELAFAKMRALESPLLNPQRPIARKGSPATQSSHLMPEGKEERPAMIDDESIQQWDAIAQVFNHPYFKRVWVAQEITTPDNRNVEFIGGKNMQRFGLSTTVQTAILLTDIYTTDKNLRASSGVKVSIQAASQAFDSLRNLTTMQIVRYRLEPRGIQRILQSLCRSLRVRVFERSNNSIWIKDVLPLLDSMRSRQATDPRDKIFAVFAILIPYSADLHIDYRLSVVEVYQNVVGDAIEKTGNLDILAHCEQKASDFPSWVPDWRQKKQSLLLCTHSNSSENRIYVSGVYKPRRIQFNHKAGKLTIRGVIVDKIRVCSQRSGPYDDKCASEWGSMVREYFGQKQWTMYKRTLVADCSRSISWRLDQPTWKNRILDAMDVLDEAIFQPDPFQSKPFFEEFHTRLQRASSKDRIKHIFRRGACAQFLDEDNNLTQNTANKAHKEEKELIEAVTGARKFCITESGCMALVPQHAEIGDEVAVLYGAHTPHILRQSFANDDNTCYQLIGESYVHGLMDGTASFKEKENDMLREQDLVLI